MDVLMVIDPADERRASAVRLGSDLLEALTGYRRSPRAARYVVLADPNDCLDIGLATLGSGDAHTVEGGERQPSPLTVIPVQARDEDALSLMYRSDDDDSGGSLHDLVSAGAVEEDAQWALRTETRNLVETAIALLDRMTFASIVVLAATPETARSLREHAKRRDVVWEGLHEGFLLGRIKEGETDGDRARRDIIERTPEFEDEQEKGAAERGIFEACLLTAAIDRLVPDEPR
nr:hypothetical protein Hi04_10k_c5380_00019 [uncultured bacterium]